MPNRKRRLTSPLSPLYRAIDRAFDSVSVRPVGLLVFLASLALLLYLHTSSVGQLRVRAVAYARTVEHPSVTSSFVSTVHVRPGEQVEPGAPLVDLSPYFIDRELSQLNVEIKELLHEQKLAQAQLLVREDRWLAPELRRQPSKPSLETPTEELFAARLRVLQTRRTNLADARSMLTISSRSAGRVASVLVVGSSVADGESVAAVTPEYAEELVAYLPPQTDPVGIQAGTLVRIVEPRMICGGLGAVLRKGAAVEQAPLQLRDLFRLRMHGTPVYISLPADCDLGVGQIVSVEFPVTGIHEVPSALM